MSAAPDFRIEATVRSQSSISCTSSTISAQALFRPVKAFFAARFKSAPVRTLSQSMLSLSTSSRVMSRNRSRKASACSFSSVLFPTRRIPHSTLITGLNANFAKRSV